MSFDFIAEVDAIQTGVNRVAFEALLDQEAAGQLDVDAEVLLYDVLGNVTITRVDDMDDYGCFFVVNVESTVYEVNNG